MKIDVDFEDCVASYVEEQKRSYGYIIDNLKVPMLALLDAAGNYQEATNLVLDLLESIPKESRIVVMEDRGYQEIEEE
jgi:hypothetical protein